MCIGYASVSQRSQFDSFQLIAAAAVTVVIDVLFQNSFQSVGYSRKESRRLYAHQPDVQVIKFVCKKRSDWIKVWIRRLEARVSRQTRRRRISRAFMIDLLRNGRQIVLFQDDDGGVVSQFPRVSEGPINVKDDGLYGLRQWNGGRLLRLSLLLIVVQHGNIVVVALGGMEQ